jgi:hypothetical protein
MAKLSDKVLKDLMKLATERATEATASVAQLADEPKDIFMIAIAVASSIIIDAARVMQADVRRSGKRKPDLGECIVQTLCHVGDGCGMSMRIARIETVTKEKK